MGNRELPTSEVAKLAGVTVDTIRKWKMRGDLKLAPTAYAGAGRGNEAMWSTESVEEVLERARENRPSGRRPKEIPHA